MIMIELTIMSFARFIQVAEYGVASLLLSARLQALAEGCRCRANERIVVPL